MEIYVPREGGIMLFFRKIEWASAQCRKYEKID